MESDEKLLEQALRGHEGSFTRLFRSRQSAIYRFALHMSGDTAVAEDVTQEVFLRVFRSLRSWDSTRPLRPWVLAIAVNRCRTCIGRRAKGPELADFLHETPDHRVADDSADLHREIRAAVDNLGGPLDHVG